MRAATTRSLQASAVVAVAVVAAATWGYARRPSAPIPPMDPGPSAAAALGPDASPGDAEDDDKPSFRLPSGAPASLRCADAKRVIGQVRLGLAYPPGRVRPEALATSVADWLDPHGLWSAAPSTPVAAALDRRAADLLREIEAPHGDCPAARQVGDVLVRWVGDLRQKFRARRGAPSSLTLDASVADAIVDGDVASRAAPAFAGLLGERVGAAERALGAAAAPFAKAAEERFFPDLDADGWSRAVLAAAVRAYVPLVDPHGAWAPLDEEASVYEVDLDAHPPVELWEKIARTALGARIESGALAPLKDGDVVLSLGGVATAGLPLEQMDQLAMAVADARGPSDAIVLRSGEPAPRTLPLLVDDGESAGNAREDLPSEHVPYGDGQVDVVAIHEVRDDLGEQMTRAVLHAHASATRVRGIVLDLRGNGGGSTDGAIAALGLFLPGATLFPMKRRDGSLETERAPEPAAAERWTGPVAALVDGNTASAAEMIAGALAAYRRGPLVGRPTYGKGCAQEYQDDDARAGVLRLTTLLYALPDGAPVQRVGITPMIRVPFAALPGEDTSGESEAKLADAPPTWRGPDVRDPDVLAQSDAGGGVAWPPPGGGVGPCRDADVCRALHALTAPSKPAPRIAAAKGR